MAVVTPPAADAASTLAGSAAGNLTKGGTQKTIASPPFPEGIEITNRGQSPRDLGHASTVAIFGPYGTGKSVLAAAISKSVPAIYFDLEAGTESLVSEGNRANINTENLTIQPLYDTIEHPYAAGIIRPLLAGKPIALCSHGFSYGICHICGDDVANYTGFNISGLGTERDDPVVIIDSGTQLDTSLRTRIYGDKLDAAWDGNVSSSIHDWRRLGALWDWYGTEIQTAHLKGFKLIMIFHEIEVGANVMPMVGTKEYAPQFGRFFSSVLRTSVEDGEYKVQMTAEGGRGHCKNRGFMPEGSIKKPEDIIKLF